MGIETQLMTGLAPPSTPHASRSRPSSHGLVATAHDGLRPLLDPPSFDNILSTPQGQPLQDRLVSSGGNSVTASYVGTTDQWATAVPPYWMQPPPDMSIAESFVEDDGSGGAVIKKDDDDADLPTSLLSDQADYKVDKADTPDVEAMLRRAVLETTSDDLERDSDCLVAQHEHDGQPGNEVGRDGRQHLEKREQRRRC